MLKFLGAPKKKDMIKTLQKVPAMVPLTAVLDELEDTFSKAAAHVNVKCIQSAEFKRDKETPGTRVVQIDYAMAYSCELQDEVQI